MTKQQEYQNQVIADVKRLLASIDKKSKAFHKENGNTWFGDLGHVREQLREIDTFLK